MTDTVRLSDWPSFHVNVKDYIRINWSRTFLSLAVECGSKFNAIIVSEGKLSDRWEEGARLHSKQKEQQQTLHFC